MSSSSSSDSSFFSSFLAAGASAGAAPPAGAAPAAGAAPTPEPTVVMSSFRLADSRACTDTVRSHSNDRQRNTHLGEESRPVGLEVNSGSLQDCNNLLGSDGDVIVGEDEGSVDAGEFRRHGGGAQVSNVDLAQREQGTRFLEIIICFKDELHKKWMIS